MNDSRVSFLRGRPLGPMRRLVLLEAAGGIAFAAVALPSSGPADRLQDWIQLLGLGLLIAMFGLTAHTWRIVISPRAWSGATAQQRQIRSERRLRRAAVLYAVLAVVLTPLPPAWTQFWFATTVFTAISAVLVLVPAVFGAAYETRPA
ncbi:hypothetical protein AB0M22_04445 [Nocardia sp. NPDC051756]|uniref:hypothetical protein n=1 Tax=Nocardia sp. NPDC051756 TaxID=3154751 RepID=UPI00342B8D99